MLWQKELKECSKNKGEGYSYLLLFYRETEKTETHPGFGLLLKSYGFTVYTYIQNYAYTDHTCHYRRTAAGKEWQGDTCNRHNAHCHSNIFEYLEEEHCCEAGYD